MSGFLISFGRSAPHTVDMYPMCRVTYVQEVCLSLINCSARHFSWPISCQNIQRAIESTYLACGVENRLYHVTFPRHHASALPNRYLISPMRISSIAINPDSLVAINCTVSFALAEVPTPQPIPTDSSELTPACHQLLKQALEGRRWCLLQVHGITPAQPASNSTQPSILLT